MKVDKIEKILAAETGKMEQLCDDITTVFAAEPIHKFRVEVKRLRAFLRLLTHQKNEPEIKLPKKFKHLYDIAGRIREAQLEIRALAKWDVTLPSYLTKLESEIAYSKQQWNEHYSPHIIKDLEEFVLGTDLQQLHPATLHSFFKTQLGIISNIANRNPDNKQIHTCRKHVKDMLYISKLVEKEWEEGLNELHGFPLLHLDGLADKLGAYNDERILLERLMQFLPTIHEGEAKTLQTLCEELRLSQFVNRKRIIEDIQNFLSVTIRWRD